MKFFKSALATAALSVGVLAAAPANALTEGSIPGGAPASNDFLTMNGLGPVDGFYGANLFLSAGGPVNILVEYFGAEAGNNNTFTYTGGTCGTPTFNHPGGGGTTFVGGAGVSAADVISSCNVMTAPGLLPFRFQALPGNPANGTNPDGAIFGALPNFFVSFSNGYTLDQIVGDAHPRSGQSVFLFLDDNGGGPGTDDNHDDMVIRLSITGGTFQVPEPGSLALAGLALLALGASGRKTIKK